MLSFWITQVGSKSNDKYPYKKQEKTHRGEVNRKAEQKLEATYPECQGLLAN